MTVEKQTIKPLDGFRVVELSEGLAAASCGRVLAYLGAEVTKVIPPEGDRLEKLGALYGMPTERGDNPLYAMCCDGKQFLTLDLGSDVGQAAMKEQISTADVFLTDLLDGELEALGLSYKTIHVLNAKLVFGQLSGYGSRGPMKDRKGSDVACYYARGGYMMDYVDEGTAPDNVMRGTGEMNAALAMSSGILTGVFAAMVQGEGRFVHTSILHTSTWMAGMNYVISQYGRDYFIDRVYRCKDGTYMFIQAVTDKQKSILLNLIGMSREDYDDHFKAIPKLAEIYEQRTFAEWCELLDGTGVCIEKLAHVREVPFDKQALANGFIQTYGNTCPVNIPVPPVIYAGCPKAFTGTV